MITHLLIGPHNRSLGRAIQRKLGIGATEASVRVFPDGESCVATSLPTGGDTVVIVHGCTPPQDTHFMQLLQLIDVANHAGYSKIICVIPYFCYARQDRRTKLGEPLSSGVLLRVLKAMDVATILTIDVHNPTIFENQPLNCRNLDALPVFLNWLGSLEVSQPILVSPDSGGADRLGKISKIMDWPLAVFSKQKDLSGLTKYSRDQHDVSGREAIIIDDICSSGSTIIPFAKELIRSGARQIHYGVVHFFADEDHIQNQIGTEINIFYTDTNAWEKSTGSTAPVFARELAKICRIHGG